MREQRSGRDTSAADVDGIESPSGPQDHHESVGERQGRQPAPSTSSAETRRGWAARELDRVENEIKKPVSSLLPASSAASIDVEAELRREWWGNHGHDYYSLYGDDGEMQCARCLVDFKRAPLDQVKAAVWKARLERAAEVAKEQADAAK